MPSPPSIFDDDEFALDRSDEVVADRPSEGAPEPAHDREHDSRRTRGPNYLFRRGVVVGGVIAVIAAAAFVVVNLRESSSDDDSSITTEWNRIIIVDPRTGRVMIDDDQGDELSRLDSAVRPVSALRVVGSTGLIVGSGPTGGSVLDLDAGTTTPIDTDATTVENPSGTALTMIAASQDGSRGVLVNGDDVLDTDTFTPIAGARYEFATSRSDPSGRNVLVTDSGNFQSVLLSFDRDEPSYFPGLALAIDDDIVVTAQNIGTAATVSIFDHDGEPISSGRTPSVRAAIIASDSVQLITIDGEIITMTRSSGDTESIGELDVGTVQSGQVAISGDQLIVTGASGTAIVGADGATLGNFAEHVPVDATATRSSTCLALVDRADDDLLIVDMADGSTTAEARAPGPYSLSADGCTIATPVSGGFQLIGGSEIRKLQTDAELVMLSPDGSSVVLDVDNRLVMAPVDDLDASMDLGPSGRSIAFAQV